MGNRKFIEIGNHYGYWKVMNRSPKEIGGHHTYYECLCVCHSKHHVRGDDLANGSSKSCGCKRSKAHLEIIGKRFSSWKVLDIDEIRDGHRYVKAVCQCGFTSSVRAYSLASGQTRSCGCRGKIINI